MQEDLSNPIVSYEIVNSENEYVTAYSVDLKKNTNGRLDPLKMAKDALKFNSSYKLFEVYSNGYRQLFIE